jgi:hypothetical protein
MRVGVSQIMNSISLLPLPLTWQRFWPESLQSSKTRTLLTVVSAEMARFIVRGLDGNAPSTTEPSELSIGPAVRSEMLATI